MNKDRRKRIEEVIKTLETIEWENAKGDLETIRDEEREAFENLHENMQGGERGQAMEAAADNLDTALEGFDEIESGINAALDALRSAME